MVFILFSDNVGFGFDLERTFKEFACEFTGSINVLNGKKRLDSANGNYENKILYQMKTPFKIVF